MAFALACPFCRTPVADGVPPSPGTCPHCRARFAGDGPTPPDAVRAALAHWGRDDDEAAFTDLLFRTDPADPATAAAITSDERDGFYHWWVFTRDVRVA